MAVLQQGDPLSSVLYCLYMKDTYNTVDAAAMVTLYAFMDNLYILGSPDQVTAAFSALKPQLQSVSLECNRTKSHFIYFQDTSKHPLPPAVLNSLENDGIEIRYDHAEVLGAIIGRDEEAIIDGLLATTPVSSMGHFFQRLRNPNLSSQAAMMLLS